MNLTHFKPESDPKLFACPCGCGKGPTNELLYRLDECREFAGVPFIVTSGPRCPAYNDKIKGAKYSAHMDGDAADIAAPDSRTRFKIVQAAFEAGFNRIGIGRDFVHLDVSDTNAQDVIFTYY